jgi:hypothetical protein
MKISDLAIEAFKVCEEIVAAGDDEVEEGLGRRLEYLEAHSAFGQALDLKPWQASPADVPDRGECTYDRSQGWAASWAQAQALRSELQAVLKSK